MSRVCEQTGLEYPISELPAAGSSIEIADGVRWLRMALPMALDHINLYLLEDDDGWWIIDCGMKGDDSRNNWQCLFESELQHKPVKAVLATHNHPDHIGQAGWLCDHWRAPFYMSYGEYFTGRLFCQQTAANLGWQVLDYYRGTGLSDQAVADMRKNFVGYSAVVEPMPSAYRRLEAGDILTIKGRQWRVLIGEGHSPEHVCLYCEQLNILLSGDQVIPRISSNVSVMGIEPEANPLEKWLTSLQQFYQLPADTLVLPSHNIPFRGLHRRIAALDDHHQQHLDALCIACDQPQTAVELLPVLFKRELNGHVMAMALGECVAHLTYLCRQGRLRRDSDERGVYRYRSA